MSESAREMLGGGLEVSVSSDYRLRRPTGPGGLRAYLLDVTSMGVDVYLPDTSDLPEGSEIFVAGKAGGLPFEVVDYSGAVQSVVTAGGAATFTLLASGAWSVSSHSFAEGVQIDPSAKFFEVSIDTDTPNVNLRTELEALFGYDGSDPALVRVTVSATVYCAASSSEAAMQSGDLPAGSSILLEVQDGAYITGRGGAGGSGGSPLPAPLPGNGGNGTVALSTSVDLTLTGSGTVQGGGGGGGGSNPQGNLPGSGGGGGGGYAVSDGGIGGTFVGPPETKGNTGRSGGLTGGGLGGAPLGAFPGLTGGAGGDPGSAGASAASGGSGGSPGDAVQWSSGVTFSKSNWLGTISGAEVAV